MSDDRKEDEKVTLPLIQQNAEHMAAVGEILRAAAVDKYRASLAPPAIPLYPRYLELRPHPEGVLIVTDKAEQLFTPADDGLHVTIWNQLSHPKWGDFVPQGRC